MRIPVGIPKEQCIQWACPTEEEMDKELQLWLVEKFWLAELALKIWRDWVEQWKKEGYEDWYNEWYDEGYDEGYDKWYDDWLDDYDWYRDDE